jgi:hypothetical protein
LGNVTWVVTMIIEFDAAGPEKSMIKLMDKLYDAIQLTLNDASCEDSELSVDSKHIHMEP